MSILTVPVTSRPDCGKLSMDVRVCLKLVPIGPKWDKIPEKFRSDFSKSSCFGVKKREAHLVLLFGGNFGTIK